MITPSGRPTQSLLRGLSIAAVAVLTMACPGGSGTAPGPRSRTYRMGFSNFPPQPTNASVIANMNAWLPRADAAILHVNVPYKQLLAGISPDSAARSLELGLVNFYRSRGLVVVYEIDVTNGLNRAREDPVLDSAGRSITEPAIQQLYRSYVKSVVRILGPDVLGLASEVNLIQLAAPAPVYAAIVTMTNDAAADVRALSPALPLYVSAQVETAWGRLSPPNTPYIGITQLLGDFPFINRLGLSSYPYLGRYTDPSQLPGDYYTRLVSGHPVPEMVVEGGWASASARGFTSSAALQAAYIARQRELLDSARATMVFQLNFADPNLAAWHLSPDSTIGLFVTIGLADSTLTPKPALAAWDSTFARPLAH